MFFQTSKNDIWNLKILKVLKNSYTIFSLKGLNKFLQEIFTKRYQKIPTQYFDEKALTNSYRKFFTKRY